MTGCGNTAAEQTSASESGQEVSGSESTQDKESSEGNIAPVSLRFVMYGEAGARDSEFLKGEFHDRVLEELNMEVSVDYVPWGGTDLPGRSLHSFQVLRHLDFRHGLAAVILQRWTRRCLKDLPLTIWNSEVIAVLTVQHTKGILF